jgi:hypothetical protein
MAAAICGDASKSIPIRPASSAGRNPARGPGNRGVLRFVGRSGRGIIRSPWRGATANGDGDTANPRRRARVRSRLRARSPPMTRGSTSPSAVVGLNAPASEASSATHVAAPPARKVAGGRGSRAAPPHVVRTTTESATVGVPSGTVVRLPSGSGIRPSPAKLAGHQVARARRAAAPGREGLAKAGTARRPAATVHCERPTRLRFRQVGWCRPPAAGPSRAGGGRC